MVNLEGGELKQKSPAEFFADNKNIAGFDNPGKSLYTTVRELVENSLDSAEAAGALPDIGIEIDEVGAAELNTLRGIANKERVDVALYHDYETDVQKQKREQKEAKQREKEIKLHQEGGGHGAIGTEQAVDTFKAPTKAGVGKAGKSYYKVTVKDNGTGMPHAQIPDMLGRVLSGTKYGVAQTRGKFGLGAKMALIWSKMTTGMPFQIRSAQAGAAFQSEYRLDIDIHKNAPNVHDAQKVPNEVGWRGTQLSVVIEGAWGVYRAYVLRYLRQIAVITPYAQFKFTYNAMEPKNGIALTFRRRTETVPAPPALVKHHPSAVNLEVVKRLLQDTRQKTLKGFLCNEFSNISPEHAGRLIRELQGGLREATRPGEVAARDATQLHQMLQSARFSDPKGDHLSPAGEYNLRLGVIKELHPDFIATHQGDVRVFEGHAFIVEAAVSLGGSRLRPGINVHRFANRIPLLFEGGSDVVTRTATKRIHWANYKISHTTDKVGVFVSIVSTKIPFKGAGKEYIGDDVEEMVAAVKSSIQQCCLQLKAKIVRRQAAQEAHERKKNLSKFVPNAVAAFMQVLESMEPQGGPKRRRLQLARDLVGEVAQGALDGKTLEQKLYAHVDAVDADMMLEHQVRQGLRSGPARDVYLVPSGSHHDYGPTLCAEGGAIRMLMGP